MKKKAPRISPFIFKLMMNLYPPFLFGRVRVKRVSKDFKYMHIRIKKSLLNYNLSGTIFGGTLFSAADPWFPLMYWQNFAIQYNQHVQVWLKKADIKYIKPAETDMDLYFSIEQEDIEKAKEALDTKGKYTPTHQVEIVDKSKNLCALVYIGVYVGVKR